MPTDRATETVPVDVPAPRVLAVLRDVESQARWVPEIQSATVLDVDDEGRPVEASFVARTAVGTDEYTLAYEHPDDGLAWTLVAGRLQTGQDGRYTVRPRGKGACTVTFELTISHHLPLPGFIRGRVVRGLVHGAVQGLKQYAEAEPAKPGRRA